MVGNVCESDLGLDDALAGTIAKEVDVIVNSAANTTFDERSRLFLSSYGLSENAKKISISIESK